MAGQKTPGGARIQPPRSQPRNDYPTSDGNGRGEPDLIREIKAGLLLSLERWYRGRPDVYVSGSIRVGYQHGTETRFVRPDVFVVPDVGNHGRRDYLVSDEGRGLDFVIEVATKTTTDEDQDAKFELYVEKLAVKEYVLFDPREKYLNPSFQMYRRFGAGFRRVKPTDGRFTSRVLGLVLERHGTDLRFRDPVTGELLPTATERADAADAEVTRLKRELARLLGERNGGGG